MKGEKKGIKINLLKRLGEERKPAKELALRPYALEDILFKAFTFIGALFLVFFAFLFLINKKQEYVLNSKEQQLEPLKTQISVLNNKKQALLNKLQEINKKYDLVSSEANTLSSIKTLSTRAFSIVDTFANFPLTYSWISSLNLTLPDISSNSFTLALSLGSLSQNNPDVAPLSKLVELSPDESFKINNISIKNDIEQNSTYASYTTTIGATINFSPLFTKNQNVYSVNKSD